MATLSCAQVLPGVIFLACVSVCVFYPALTFTSYRNLKSTGSSTAFSTASAKFTAPLPKDHNLLLFSKTSLVKHGCHEGEKN